MRQLMLIGIGAGHPDHLTLQAVRALNRVDVLLLTDKGNETAELLETRRNVCRSHMHRPFRTVEIMDAERDRTAADYHAAVDTWHEQRAAAYEEVLRDQVADGECAAFLVWGDPSLYDSTLRIVERVLARGRVNFDYEVIPGITSVQALCARHRVPMNAIGSSIRITTGRRLAAGPPTVDTNVLVMLDGAHAFEAIQDPDVEIYWGAFLGTPDEILIHGRLGDVGTQIRDARAAARRRKGWIMDTYLLRKLAR